MATRKGQAGKKPASSKTQRPQGKTGRRGRPRRSLDEGAKEDGLGPFDPSEAPTDPAGGVVDEDDIDTDKFGDDDEDEDEDADLDAFEDDEEDDDGDEEDDDDDETPRRRGRGGVIVDSIADDDDDDSWDND